MQFVGRTPYSFQALTFRTLLVVLAVGIGSSLTHAETPTPFGFNKESQEKPLAQKSLLLAADCLKTRCLLVGERGHLLDRKSGDTTFSQLSSPSQSQMNDVAVVSNDLAYAVGEDGTILKIEGSKATRVYSDLDEDSPFFAIQQLSSGSFLVAGAYGYCVKGKEKEWEGCDIDPEERHIYRIIKLPSGGLLAVGESGLIARAESEESEFELKESPYSGSLFGALAFSSGEKNYVLAFGLRGKLLISEDGGQTFGQIKIDSEQSLLAGVPVGKDRVVLVGLGGTLLDISLSENKVIRSESLNGRPALTDVIRRDNTLLLTSDRGIIEFKEWTW